MTKPDTQTVQQLQPKYGNLPIGSGKAARDLTHEEARDLVVYYVLQNLLELVKAPAVAKDGSLTYPKTTDKPQLTLSIGGVSWVPDNKKAAGLKATGAMDMRTAVLAVRLAQYLASSRWGVDTIYWGGMGFGRSSDDRHGKGFAIDFHGASGSVGKLDVSRDWGQQPIPLPNGKQGRDWPVGQQPYFRLDVDTPAGGFFYDVYHWLTGEAADGKRGGSSIGDHSFILCPDTPDAAYRPSHQDHIHCEIDR